jgi:hypothetical protein
MLSRVLAMFSRPSYTAAMPDETDHLRPTTPDELVQTLSFALRYEGRRRVHHADSFMAQVAAERLVEHLRLSGFVVMKKGPAAPPKVPG